MLDMPSSEQDNIELDAACLFCGGGEEDARRCGPLRPAGAAGGGGCVHHWCALWAPSVYQREGSSAYLGLEGELLRAQALACTLCGGAGAAIPCSHPGCLQVYHLPCAQRAPLVQLEQESFELWCPDHADPEAGQAEADDHAHDRDFTLSPAPRPRRQTAGSHSRARLRAPSAEAARPRTDWQRRGEHTWIKAVPPWWCEQRTVHFATRVFKELFQSAPSATLVDGFGMEREVTVQTEARNDMRPQYTLRGEGWDALWQGAAITAGDVLTFTRDPGSGKITLGKLPQGLGSPSGGAGTPSGTAGGRATPASVQPGRAAGRPLFASARGQTPAAPRPRLPPSDDDDDSEDGSDGLLQQQSSEGTLGSGRSGSRGRGSRAGGGGQGASSSERGQSQQSSHPNRWHELADGWAIKTVYKSTLQHQQCPIAGWLFKKLYGRLPDNDDRMPVHDPDLRQSLAFDVHFVSAANVHYITGRGFGGWMREAGLRAGEQIKVRRDGVRVLFQRVPTNQKIQVDFAAKGGSRSRDSKASAGSGEPAAVISRSHLRRAASSSLREPLGGAALGASGSDDAALCGGGGGSGGCQHGLSPLLASPPAQAALEALDALAAAAGYAGKHGTPAIQAALAQAPEAAAAFATAVAAMQASGGGGTPPGVGAAAAAAVAARRTASPAVGAAHPYGLPAQDPSPKRQRTSEPPASTPPPSAVWPMKLAFGGVGGKNVSSAATGWPSLPFQQQQQQQGAAAGAAAASWQPATAQAQVFGAVLAALEAAHAPFTAEERGVLLAFRARCVVLDACAREVALVSLRDFGADRAAALALMRSVLEAGGPSPAAVAAGGSGGGGGSLLPSLHGGLGGDGGDADPASGPLQDGGLTLPPGKRAQPAAWQGDKAAGGTDEEEGHLAAMLLGGEGAVQEHSSGLLSML